MDKKSRNFLYKLLLKHSTKQKKQKNRKRSKIAVLEPIGSVVFRQSCKCINNFSWQTSGINIL